MNVLVTAGNTQVPIDRVRCITNIFTGRTGASIALHCQEQGHSVTLLTSHPEVVDQLRPKPTVPIPNWQVESYRTFADLRDLLKAAICQTVPDVIIHCAAVSDYQSAGIFAPSAGTYFDPTLSTWSSAGGDAPTLRDVMAGKVKSDAPELWLRLVRAPKLIDLFRKEWGFRGILVKFKLEVGVDEATLLEIAEASRRQSQADLMVANTLEGSSEWALLGPLTGRYQRIARGELPARLLEAINIVRKGRAHG